MSPPRETDPPAAVITAAGGSRRMMSGEKKEYRIVDGKPVLARAVLPFFVSCRSIVVTVPAGHIPRVERLLAPHLDIERIRLVEGGGSRQESVLRGLESLAGQSPWAVLIHDGARPWLSPGLIERVIAAVREHGACIPVLEAFEALKRIDPAGFITEDIDRRQIALAQTPQGFRFSEILEAHRRARSHPRPCFDDAEIYAAFVGPVFTIPGERANRKITFPEDLEAPSCG